MIYELCWLFTRKVTQSRITILSKKDKKRKQSWKTCQWFIFIIIYEKNIIDIYVKSEIFLKRHDLIDKLE